MTFDEVIRQYQVRVDHAAPNWVLSYVIDGQLESQPYGTKDELLHALHAFVQQHR